MRPKKQISIDGEGENFRLLSSNARLDLIVDVDRARLQKVVEGSPDQIEPVVQR